MQNAEMNVAYQVLQQAVKPNVRAICIKQEDMATFNGLLTDIETYLFAKKIWINDIKMKESAYL